VFKANRLRVNLRGNLTTDFSLQVQRFERVRVNSMHIQSLESYQLDDLPAGRNKKEPQHFPEDRDSHDSTLLI
jgi:hypothetical protein